MGAVGLGAVSPFDSSQGHPRASREWWFQGRKNEISFECLKIGRKFKRWPKVKVYDYHGHEIYMKIRIFCIFFIHLKYFNKVATDCISVPMDQPYCEINLTCFLVVL